MTKAISVFFGIALLMAAPTAFAAETITKITVQPSLVAPSDDVEITIDVDLSNGDDWDAVAYRFESGDFFCVDTPDHFDNVQGTKSVSEIITVPAPAIDDLYHVDIRLYDEDDCDDQNGVISPFDNDHIASDTEHDALTVETPDQCPNVNGYQNAGPCADSLCIAPDYWSMANQACVAPAPQNAPNPTPAKGSSITGGGGLCNPASGYPECQKPANIAHFAGQATVGGSQQLVSLYTQLITVLSQILVLLN